MFSIKVRLNRHLYRSKTQYVKVGTMTIAEDEFAAVAASLKRWSERSLGAARDMLLDNRTFKEAAEAHAMTPQQARVIQHRFLEKLRQQRVVKVSADEYLSGKHTIDLFRPELVKLRRAGLPDSELLDFLAQNDIHATTGQLNDLLSTNSAKGSTKHENTHARKSKRRRR